MIRMVIFDIDGTLAQSSTLILLPHVKSFFQLALSGDCPNQPKIAIATNQGGVGMRYWMEQNHFGRPEKYPSLSDVETRMQRLLVELNADSQIPLYASFRYQDKKAQWSPVPPGKENDPRWSQDWRKPGPGMLLQAMADAGVSPEETAYIGDRDEDQGAAMASGCAFQWAKDFFSSEWEGCEDLSARLNKIRSMGGVV